MGVNGGILAGLISGFNYGTIAGLNFGLYFGLNFGLIVGLIVGSIVWLNLILMDFFERYGGENKGHIIGGRLIFGLILALSIEMIGNFSGGLLGRLFGGLIFGLIMTSGVIFGLVSILIGTLGSRGKEKVQFTSELLIPLVTLLGMLGGLVFGLSGGVIAWPYRRMIVWFSSGLIAWLILEEVVGCFAIIQKQILYFIIARNNFLPLRLLSFLNYCVDHIFLRKVGSGYIFMHRLLMEHFAMMYPEET